MAWSLIHAGWMHYLLAIFNAHDWTMRYVTNFSAKIFSLLNILIYFNKAIQELRRIHESNSFASFLYAIIGAVGTCFVAMFLSTAPSWKPLFHRHVRMLLSEYAAAISIVILIGVPYVGELADLDKRRLQVSRTFRPTSPERTGFFARFWEVPVGWVFAAIVPGIVFTILFFFDHEISSIICTVKRYHTKKPGGYAWDILLLGTTTALCGMLGIPPANGLLPQAPLHSKSLMHSIDTQPRRPNISSKEREQDEPVRAIHEQRWSHFLHAVCIMAFISPPLMHVLGLTPTSVLAGLFLFMGGQSLGVKCVATVAPRSKRQPVFGLPASYISVLSSTLTFLVVNSPILGRVALLFSSSSERAPLPESVRSCWSVHAYSIVQIAVKVGVFVLTFTKAAPVCPLIFIVLVPIRLLVMKRLWDRDTLRYVDGWACKDGTPEDDNDDDNADPFLPSHAAVESS